MIVALGQHGRRHGHGARHREHDQGLEALHRRLLQMMRSLGRLNGPTRPFRRRARCSWKVLARRRRCA